MVTHRSARDPGGYDRSAIALMTLWAVLSVSVVTSGAWPRSAQTALLPAVASQATSTALVPYESLADVPREAWFRRIGPTHLVDLSTWWKVTSVDPSDGSLAIGGRYWLPNDMLGHWVYTLDPFATNPTVLQCGKPAPVLIPAPAPVIPAKAGIQSQPK